MSVPGVTITKVDNQLGAASPEGGDRLACVGNCSAGPIATAILFALPEDVVATFVSGPLVEDICYELAHSGGRPVLGCRTDETAVGAYGTVTFDGDGLCTAAADATVEPFDLYEVLITCLIGTDIGTTGGTYKWSLDGGRTESGAVALLTATSIEIEEANVKIDLSASQTFTTVFATDILTFSGAGYPDGTALYVKNTGGALPAPLVAGTVYYTRDRSTNTSKLAATLGGIAINLSTDGTGVHSTRHTLVAGDTIAVRTSAPQYNGVQLDAALVAIQESDYQWDICEVSGPITAALVATIETRAAAMEVAEMDRRFIVSARVPNAGESDATYAAAMNTEFGATVATHVTICAGAAEIQSPVSQRRYLAHISRDCAAYVVTLRPGQDPASRKLGPRPAAVQILDSRRNLKHHDEAKQKSLDGFRFTTFRTWRNKKGVYYNNVRLFSETGSDHEFIQHGRVSDKVCGITRRVLADYTSDDLYADPETGRILESEAADIDVNVRSAVETELVEDISAYSFVLSRTDNVLSTKTLRGNGRVTPKIYPKQFNVRTSFFNPALNVVATED